jgi:hypothetical protein
VVVPYIKSFPNIYLKDICLEVDESFYVWIYEEMRKQNSLVILSFDSNLFTPFRIEDAKPEHVLNEKTCKVVPGYGDALINIDVNCKETKEWMDLDYEAWLNKKTHYNVFTIQLVNPFLYMVPFPVKPIIIKTQKRIDNYITIYT